MYNTHTKFWQKKISNQYVLEDSGQLTCLALVALGVVAAILHEQLRLGLNMPGHHGLEWMALLVFGRSQSHYRWAGLYVGMGAATAYLTQTMLMSTFLSMQPVLVYLFSGAAVDLLFRSTPGNLPIALKAALLGGVSFILKPLLLMIIAVLFEISFGSFVKHGFGYPLLSHFLFGTIGAMAGLCLAHAMDTLKSPKAR